MVHYFESGLIFRRLSTTREEEATSKDLCDETDEQQFPYQLPKQPKFQPFIGEVNCTHSNVIRTTYSPRKS